MSSKFWIVFLVSGALCVSASPALAQVDLSGSKIGPPKGEIVGAIVGAAAAVALVVYFAIPKQKTIEGCVEPGDGGLQLKSDKDKRIYALDTNALSLQPGQRVTLKGKLGKKHSGTRHFGVNKLVKDEGTCGGHASLLAPRLFRFAILDAT